jgi:hypothetical protein
VTLAMINREAHGMPRHLMVAGALTATFTNGVCRCCKMKAATLFPGPAMTLSMIQFGLCHGACSKFWRHPCRCEGTRYVTERPTAIQRLIDLS